MAYAKTKDLVKRTQSVKVLKDKAFKIASIPKFLDKKSSGSGIFNEPNYQLANELHKPIIRTFTKIKVYSSLRDNIWGVDLADMQSLSKYNKEIEYLLRAIDLFSKYVWVVPIKDKKGTSIVNAFQKIISKGSEAESKGRRKPNKIWVDQGSEFYNNSFKSFLKINNIEMYSTYNEETSVVAERFIRTLKNKIFEYMTAISKHVYFDALSLILLINTITQFIELLKCNLLILRMILMLNTMKIFIK